MALIRIVERKNRFVNGNVADRKQENQNRDT